MTNSSITDLVDAYPILGELSEQALEMIRKGGRRLELPAGKLLFDERDQCAGFPLVKSGSIRVLKSAPNGRELPLYTIAPGDSCLVTSGCLLGNTAYPVKGVTLTAVEMFVIPPALFFTLLEEKPFRTFVFNLFSEKISDLMELVGEVAFSKLDQRLAGLLLGKGKVINTTHQQLADELGSVREMVSRLLKGFSDQGWVGLSREHIEILDPRALRNFAEGRHSALRKN